MELFGSEIISSKPFELSCPLKDSSSLRSIRQRKGDLRGVVRMGRKAAVLCRRGFKVPRDLTSDPREGDFSKSIEVAGSSATHNCSPESTRSCKNPTQSHLPPRSWVGVYFADFFITSFSILWFSYWPRSSVRLLPPWKLSKWLSVLLVQS